MKHQFLCKRNFIQKSEFCPQPRLKQKVDSGIEFINGEIYIGEDSIYGAVDYYEFVVSTSQAQCNHSL